MGDEVTLPLEERIERIGSRVVCAFDGELLGPMEDTQALALHSERPGSSCHVWTTREPRWRSLS